MCGRYALSVNASELIEEFELTADKTKGILPIDWNIAPTREIYIIKNNFELHTASWGLIAPWSKDRGEAIKSQSQAINARTETVHEKPTFRSAFKSKRCLIPASGYYEWATELGLPSKQPFYIHSDKKYKDRNSTLLFAGIYDQWVDRNGEIFESAAIITRPAFSFLAKIHNRMPTFLPVDRYRDWLDPKINDLSEIRSMLEIDEPTRGLIAEPVSSRVNKVANNGPELIEPIELGASETLF